MSETASMALPPQTSERRIELLDLARGLALVAMATYHFAWDIEQFGYLEPGITGHGPLKLYARSIASSFLFLAGVSLVLAHGAGVRPQAFLKRLAMVGGAAGLITAATIFATPDAFIYFGILHAIAASSIIGLALLRLPGLLLIALGAFCIALPQVYQNAAFDPRWLSWIGLFATPPRSNDFVPLLPWLGPFVIGMGCARIAIQRQWTIRLAEIRTGDGLISRILRFCGRHSLAFYLVHQPVLLAMVWSVHQVAPPAPVDPLPGFLADCRAGCEVNNEAEFCMMFCGCVIDELLSQSLFDPLIAGEITPETDPRIPAIVDQCTISEQNSSQ